VDLFRFHKFFVFVDTVWHAVGFFVVFEGEINVEYGLGHTGGRGHDKVKCTRNSFMHMNVGQAGFFTKRCGQILD
jgi:hypothetical protein